MTHTDLEPLTKTEARTLLAAAESAGCRKAHIIVRADGADEARLVYKNKAGKSFVVATMRAAVFHGLTA